jgi:1-acyl-sn-glycerol-3-phosphate acyltransferase
MIDEGKNTVGIRLLRGTFLLLMRLLFRIEHHGWERIPANGPLLIISNHVTYFDPFWIGVRCYRAIRFIAWDKLFGFAPARMLFRWFGAFPVSLTNPESSAYKQALGVLQRGEALVMFPEGGRADPGRLMPFKEGFARLALRTGATIVPVVIQGGEHVWGRPLRLPRPGKVRVNFLEPIPKECFASTAGELAIQVRNVMEKQ